MEVVLGVDTNMSDVTERTPIIDRGLALHKLIRCVQAPWSSCHGWLTRS